MRIVHLLPSTDDAGAERQALYLLSELRNRPTIDLELAYFRPGRAHDRFTDLGIPMRRIAPWAKLVLDRHRRAWHLRLAYRDRPPQILHTWMYEANVVGATAAVRWPETRLVMAERSGNRLQSDPRRFRTMRALYHVADYVLANSDAGASLAAEAGGNSIGVSVVPNAVPPERTTVTRSRTAVRRELGVDETTPLACAVGRPDEAKDWPTLMAALERARERAPRLVLVLIGPELGELTRLGVIVPSGVTALGWIAHPADIMAASDVVVVSSKTEGHSNVVDEALMLGRPVATTDAGAHPVLVRKAGGRVVPISDPRRLGEAIVQLIDDPPDPRQVRRSVFDDLAPQAAARVTLAAYDRVMAADGGTSIAAAATRPG